MKSSKPIMPFPRRALPPMARVRQRLPSDHIADIRSDMREKLIESRPA